MIVSQIFGGLGNQLFQYAAGAVLAKRLNVEHQINTQFYDKGQPVELDFRLDKYCLDATEVDRKLLPARSRDGLINFFLSQFRHTDLKGYKEASFELDNDFFSLKDQTYLLGYWQNEKYFDNYATFIRELFTIKSALSAENKAVADEINNCVAVSLHIRRGAFVSNSKFNAIHGTPALDYYCRAADLIAEKCQHSPTFFAFSDEPEWVKENLKLPFDVRVVSHNGPADNYEDIRLMSHCQHHITANSSFSWWGAWLNPSPEKIVIAPNQWFADLSMQHDPVPKNWLRL